MPWINKEMCTSCGVCVEECPVGAITLEDDGALINEEDCIRCGRCHDVCPEEAARHDSERIPQEVEANIDWAKKLLGNFDTKEEKDGLIERLERFFKKEIKVAEKTIERLKQMET